MDLPTEEELRRYADRAGLTLSADPNEVLDRVRAALDRSADLPAQPTDEPVEPLATRDAAGNAYVTRCAATTDAAGPLAGTRVAVKDNIAVAGLPTTCGLRAFADVVPQRHATVVRRLLDAGATLTGKTNMDALALGPTGETSDFGPVPNPVAPDHVAGGSSSGSAAAVATGAADVALGTDTGGSVRIPAAFSGVVGFKPSWGIIPTEGVVDLAPSLDHVGVLGTDVDLVRATVAVLAGGHGEDRPDSSDSDRNAPRAEELAEFSLAVPDALVANVSGRVEARFETVLSTLRDLGVPVSRTTLDLTGAATAWRTIVATELAAWFVREGVPIARRTGFGPEMYRQIAAALDTDEAVTGAVVERAVLEGIAILEADGMAPYARAQTVRSRRAAALLGALGEFDALLSPTMPVTAPRLGEWSPDTYGQSVPLATNTRPANLAGLPALSVPAGRAGGLPVGIQFIGPAGADRRLLDLGARVASAIPS